MYSSNNVTAVAVAVAIAPAVAAAIVIAVIIVLAAVIADAMACCREVRPPEPQWVWRGAFVRPRGLGG